VSIRYFACSKRFKCDVVTRLRYNLKTNEVYLESTADQRHHIHLHEGPGLMADAFSPLNMYGDSSLAHSQLSGETPVGFGRYLSSSFQSAADSSSCYVTEGCFGSYISTEALPGALPEGQNSPQVCPYGLYAEQLSGSAFTAQPRARNLRSWLYRIRPSVCSAAPGSGQDPEALAGGWGRQFRPLSSRLRDEFNSMWVDPNPLRWDPPTRDASELQLTDFVDGLQLVCGGGDPAVKDGLAIYTFLFGRDMTRSRPSRQSQPCSFSSSSASQGEAEEEGDGAEGEGPEEEEDEGGVSRAISNADGDLLFVPQSGVLRVTTEFGLFAAVEPGHILVIPRGMKFSVDRVASPSPNLACSGYLLEVFGGHFELPSLGPIGANGLANPRDFQIPRARYQDSDGPQDGFQVVTKFQHCLFATELAHCPFDVVAWHGNYYPYMYNLRRFNCINTVSFDHPDPSIYTVLTVPALDGSSGSALADLVLFPPRWMVAEHTFRPPYFHRNVMTEFMGLIEGKYDAKADQVESGSGGFRPGGASLHSCMTPHGPDGGTFLKAVSSAMVPQTPVYFNEGMAFMFETHYVLKVASSALAEASGLQLTYAQDCWGPEKLPKLFTGERHPALPINPGADLP